MLLTEDIYYHYPASRGDAWCQLAQYGAYAADSARGEAVGYLEKVDSHGQQKCARGY